MNQTLAAALAVAAIITTIASQLASAQSFQGEGGRGGLKSLSDNAKRQEYIENKGRKRK